MLDNYFFLPQLPEELRKRAMLPEVGHWPAWEVDDIATVMDYLVQNHIAANAGFLVTQRRGAVRDGYETVEGEYHYTMHVEPKIGESWQEFAARSGEWIVEWAQDFAPAKPLSEPVPERLGFIIVWMSEEEYLSDGG